MKCLINGLNVKVLCRAIHSLAKIGDELHVEPLPVGLSFRSVNASRSAYASILLESCFFSHYEYEGDTDSHPDNEDIKCKISMKSCLNVFRTPSSMDKNVESCKVTIAANNDNLIFELRFKYGISKIYFLPIIECEALQAVYKIDNVPNLLSAPSKVLVDAINNFQQSQDEITLSVNSDKVTLSNFVENAPDPTKVMRTELSLNSGEFDIYSVSAETSITFRLKELRSLLTFGEGVNLPIAINFETRGRPVVFVIKAINFEANFVLATLSSPTDTQSNCSQSTSITEKTSANATPRRVNGQTPVRRTTPSNSIPSIQTNSRSDLPRTISLPSTISINHKDAQCHSQSSMFDFNKQGSSSKRTPPSTSKRLRTSTSNGLNTLSFNETSERARTDLDADEDIMPASPELDTRSRYIFKRCFEATFNPRNIPGYNEVLAEDSAEEDN